MHFFAGLVSTPLVAMIFICGPTLQRYAVVGGRREPYRGYGNQARVSCPPNFVLTETYVDGHKRLELQCLPQMVCYKPGVCVRQVSKSSCNNKGEFMAGLVEINGKLGGRTRAQCCQFHLPEEEEIDEVCRTVTIKNQRAKYDEPVRASIADNPPRYHKRKNNKKGAHKRGRKGPSMKHPKPASDGGPEKKVDIFNAREIHALGFGSFMGVKSVKRGKKSYTVRLCKLQCRRTTTTKRPTTPPPPKDQRQNNPTEPDVSKYGTGSFSCFGPSETATTARGPVRMDQLRENDQVLVFDTVFNAYSYSPIDWFIHRDGQQWANFVTIQTEAGTELSLTEDHLLPVLPCEINLNASITGIKSLEREFMTEARNAKSGRCLMINRNFRPALEPITGVRISRAQGVYAPVTREGNIVVSGAHVSCFASRDPLSIQRSMFSALRAARNFIHSFQGILEDSAGRMNERRGQQVDVPFVIHMLSQAYSLVV
jgi:hypothetical protein